MKTGYFSYIAFSGGDAGLPIFLHNFLEIAKYPGEVLAPVVDGARTTHGSWDKDATCGGDLKQKLSDSDFLLVIFSSDSLIGGLDQAYDGYLAWCVNNFLNSHHNAVKKIIPVLGGGNNQVEAEECLPDKFKELLSEENLLFDFRLPANADDASDLEKHWNSCALTLLNELLKLERSDWNVELNRQKQCKNLHLGMVYTALLLALGWGVFELYNNSKKPAADTRLNNNRIENVVNPVAQSEKSGDLENATAELTQQKLIIDNLEQQIYAEKAKVMKLEQTQKGFDEKIAAAVAAGENTISLQNNKLKTLQNEINSQRQALEILNNIFNSTLQNSEDNQLNLDVLSKFSMHYIGIAQDTYSRIIASDVMIEIFLNGGFLTTARELLDLTLPLKKEFNGDSSVEYLQALADIGGILLRQNQLNEAADKLYLAENILRRQDLKKNPVRLILAQVMDNLGEISSLKGDDKIAMVQLADAKEIIDTTRGGERLEFLKVDNLIKLGRVYAAELDYPAAESAYSEADKLIRKLPARRRFNIKLADTLMALGDLYDRQQKYSQAVASYVESLGILRKSNAGNMADLNMKTADCATALGVSRHCNGESIAALADLESAANVYRELLQNSGEAAIKHKMVKNLCYTAELCFAAKLALQAESAFNEAEKLCEELAVGEKNYDRDWYGKNLTRMAEVSLSMANFKNAEKYYSQALSFYRAGSNYEDKVGIILNDLGNLFRRQTLYRDAEQYYTEALKVREKLVKSQKNNSGALADLASTQNNLAILCESTLQFKTAADYYEKALAIRRQLLEKQRNVENALAFCRTAKGYGDLLLEQKIDLALGRKLIDEANSLMQEYRQEPQMVKFKAQLESMALIQ
ncbi:MAG: tetratricopeptide repeat protein [Lentisphaeria bacterium]|nr:tetratricopeptide repeat protein [Lentisphaeria bacterium]